VPESFPAIVLGPDDLDRAVDIDRETRVLRAERVTFGDGEQLVRLPAADQLRGHHVLVVQTTSPPQDERVATLLQLVDIVTAAGASSVTCLTPYLSYQRQDRRSQPGEALTARILPRSLAAFGVNALITVDRHSDLTPLPGEVPVVNVTSTRSFADFVRSAELQADIVVSPDRGGMKRAEQLAVLLGLPAVAMSKLKDPDRGTYYEGIPAEVRGRRCLVVEDLCSTGTTLVPLCAALEPHVPRIDLLVTHILTSLETIAGRVPVANVIGYSDSCGDSRAPVHVLPAAIAAWRAALFQLPVGSDWSPVAR
jgi:ribose-phosphate pyrophosphokinase